MEPISPIDSAPGRKSHRDIGNGLDHLSERAVRAARLHVLSAIWRNRLSNRERLDRQSVLGVLRLSRRFRQRFSGHIRAAIFSGQSGDAVLAVRVLIAEDDGANKGAIMKTGKFRVATA